MTVVLEIGQLSYSQACYTPSSGDLTCCESKLQMTREEEDEEEGSVAPCCSHLRGPYSLGEENAGKRLCYTF